MECIIQSAPIDEVQLLATLQTSYETVTNFNHQGISSWQFPKINTLPVINSARLIPAVDCLNPNL